MAENNLDFILQSININQVLVYKNRVKVSIFMKKIMCGSSSNKCNNKVLVEDYHSLKNNRVYKISIL